MRTRGGANADTFGIDVFAMERIDRALISFILSLLFDVVVRLSVR